METADALKALSALAQETRLEAFRVLVKRGPDGMSAGALADTLQVPPATLSFHLKELVTAKLLTSRRESRSIIYSADFTGMRVLITYLVQDCCQGHPELCGLLDSMPDANQAIAS